MTSEASVAHDREDRATTSAPVEQNRREVELAIAARAYATGRVRLASRDLTGFDHLLASRRGLFAVGPQGFRQIAYGLFFGITVSGADIFLFEACDRPRLQTGMGRLIRLTRAGAEIVDSAVIATGLDNDCHQIDIIDGLLCVLDTANQAVLRFDLDGTPLDTVRPLPMVAQHDWGGGYAHINALIAQDDSILLMLHNGGREHRASEIARFDRDWRLIDRTGLPGFGCHNLAVLEDGAVLACGSMDGELIDTAGNRTRVSDAMTRGLSVDVDQIVIGESPFAEREMRDEMKGAVLFLDRDLRRRAVVPVPGPPTEIRRIDGRDRSLSHFVALTAGMKG